MDDGDDDDDDGDDLDFARNNNMHNNSSSSSSYGYYSFRILSSVVDMHSRDANTMHTGSTDGPYTWDENSMRTEQFRNGLVVAELCIS